jgi:adenine-specific DNA-methyltransferase
MAKLEDLIKQIPDAKLRAEIAREAAALKSTKKFGLVFEEHIPERVQLPGLPVRIGSRVVKRGNGKQVFQVVDIKGNTARLAPEPEGQEETAKLDELVIVKRFGEPIYPTLTPRERIERAPDKPWHTIINADNFHALQLLLYCYEGMVDVIYIDPPYNTGARDWKYNNDYVDVVDEYRHSKWLAMMKKRLKLARRLLNPETGVLIVTIDEHEVHHLGILLEDEFFDSLRQMVTIVINQKGVAQGGLSRAEEYAFFCFAKDATVYGQDDDLLSPERPNSKRFTTPRWEWLLRGGTNSRREDRPNLFFPIYIDPIRKVITGIGDTIPLSQAPSVPEDQTVAWPLRTDGSLGNWRVSPPTLRDLVSKGYVKLGGYDQKRKTWTVLYLGQQAQTQIETGIIRIASRDTETNVVEIEYVGSQERQVKTVWHRGTHDSGTYGSTMLRTLLGGNSQFSFPKSLYSVRDTLSIVTRRKPNALILDFFAGSGTTLHATAMLNEEDNGNRRCILVTNNELNEKIAKQLNEQGIFAGQPEFEQNGICEAVTFPRCKYVINGKRDDGTELSGVYLNGREMKEGFEENVEYFRLDFLDSHEVAYGEKFEAILPILWLMSGAQGKRENDKGEKAWFIPKGSPFAVLIDEHTFSQFKQAIAKRADLTHIFLVTDSMEAYRSMLAQLPDTLQTKMLYKSYLDNFRINTEQSP